MYRIFILSLSFLISVCVSCYDSGMHNTPTKLTKIARELGLSIQIKTRQLSPVEMATMYGVLRIDNSHFEPKNIISPVVTGIAGGALYSVVKSIHTTKTPDLASKVNTGSLGLIQESTSWEIAESLKSVVKPKGVRISIVAVTAVAIIYQFLPEDTFEASAKGIISLSRFDSINNAAITCDILCRTDSTISLKIYDPTDPENFMILFGGLQKGVTVSRMFNNTSSSIQKWKNIGGRVLEFIELTRICPDEFHYLMPYNKDLEKFGILIRWREE